MKPGLPDEVRPARFSAKKCPDACKRRHCVTSRADQQILARAQERTQSRPNNGAPIAAPNKQEAVSRLKVNGKARSIRDAAEPIVVLYLCGTMEASARVNRPAALARMPQSKSS